MSECPAIEVIRTIIDPYGFTGDQFPFSPDGVVQFADYGEFGIWRLTHKTHKDPGGLTPRCPRCFSQKIKTAGEYIKCSGCGYSENLIDFPTAY